MSKLTIEVQYDEGLLPMTHLKVDGEPVGCIQALKFEAGVVDGVEVLKIDLAFPDTDLGWANAEKAKKLPFAEVHLLPLTEKK